MRDALDTTFTISQLVKFSPRRDTHFETLKKDLAPECPGLRVLCPTRWTVCADSLASVIANYTVLQELWDDCMEFVNEAETRARIIGVSEQMRKFEYLFGVALGELCSSTVIILATAQRPISSTSSGSGIIDNQNIAKNAK